MLTLTFAEKLKIFNKRFIYLVKYFRYFVGKLQFFIKIKMQLNPRLNEIIQQMDNEKKSLLLDHELQVFDLNFLIQDLSIVIADYKDYKQELLFFFLEYEDFLLRAIDISIVRELNSFVMDFSYLLECFENLNKLVEQEALLNEETARGLFFKEFFSKFYKFYKSIKVYFWFVEKAEEDVLSETLMKNQNEISNYFLSPWATSEEDYDAERLDGSFPLLKVKGKNNIFESEEEEYSDFDFIIAYGSFSDIDIEAEIARDPLLNSIKKK